MSYALLLINFFSQHSPRKLRIGILIPRFPILGSRCVLPRPWFFQSRDPIGDFIEKLSFWTYPPPRQELSNTSRNSWTLTPTPPSKFCITNHYYPKNMINLC